MGVASATSTLPLPLPFIGSLRRAADTSGTQKQKRRFQHNPTFCDAGANDCFGPNAVVAARGQSWAFNRSAGTHRGCGAKPVHLPAEQLRKNPGDPAPRMHSNHDAEVGTATRNDGV